MANLQPAGRFSPLLLTASLAVGLFSAARAELPDLLSFMISPGQVYEAGVMLGEDGHTVLRLTLKPERALEFRDFTDRNLKKQVKIFVNGRVMIRPMIQDRIISGMMDLPVASPEAGLETARALMAKPVGQP